MLLLVNSKRLRQSAKSLNVSHMVELSRYFVLKVSRVASGREVSFSTYRKRPEEPLM